MDVFAVVEASSWEPARVGGSQLKGGLRGFRPEAAGVGGLGSMGGIDLVEHRIAAVDESAAMEGVNLFRVMAGLPQDL